MNDFTISGPEWFEGASEAVLLIREGAVVYCNSAAAALGFFVQQELPEELGALEAGASAAVRWQGKEWLCRSAAVADGILLQLTQQRGGELTTDRLRQLAAKMRIPLGNLIGAIQLLEYPRVERSEEKRRQYQAIEHKNYHILLRMLDDLELLGSLDGEQPFRPTVLDFGGLCADVTRSVEYLAQQTGRSVGLEVKDGNLLVEGEEHLLRRMLYHLISNALRASGDGGAVRLRLEKRGKQVRLTVSDSGEGFSPQELGRAFDPSDAAEDLVSAGGLGVGISICRQIAQRHNGRIALLGGGSGGMAVVELPLAQSVEGGALQSPADYTGGLNEVLTRLSDVLPWQCFVTGDGE